MKIFTGRYLPFWGSLLASGLFWSTLAPDTRQYLKYAIFLVPVIWSMLTLRASSNASSERESEVPTSFGKRLARRLSGEYAQYWYSAVIFWIATVYWVAYPHPATFVGMIALSFYLALYFPLYISLCRAFNRLLRVPVWLCSPICWVAIEWLRNRVFGGFSFCGLSHALYDVPNLIQIAEPLGEYGVEATIVLVGSLVGCAIIRRLQDAPGVGGRRSVRLVSFAAILVFCSVLYGNSRIAFFDQLESEAIAHGRPSLKVGLMQECTQYRFPPAQGLDQEVSDKYRALAAQAVKDDPEGFDLLVWPEGCERGFFLDADADYADLTDFLDSTEEPRSDVENDLEKRYPVFFSLTGKERDAAEFDLLYARDQRIRQRRNLATLTSKLGCAVILGTASAVFHEYGDPTTYNSAIYVPFFGSGDDVKALAPSELSQSPVSTLLEERSDVFRRYDKIHLVMFGEYVPFLKYFPSSWEIKSVCAQSVLGRGRGPTAFRVTPRDSMARFILAPNICFESLIPQFIKNQVRELRSVDADPDILVNLSHDGWFRCGIETDLHLATHVYRAIENRRSVITATHGGFSAWVDPAGRIRAKGARGETSVVTAKICVVKTRRLGLFENWDLAETSALVCACLSYAVWAFGLVWTRFRKPGREPEKAAA